jgi:hypothetical protein
MILESKILGPKADLKIESFLERISMTRPDVYLLGRAAGEEARLKRQIADFAPDSDAQLEKIGIKHGERVLDIGCGPGGVRPNCDVHRRDPQWPVYVVICRSTTWIPARQTALAGGDYQQPMCCEKSQR